MKSEIRIIGGGWRGRRLAVVDAVGLRPTPDRIRETLFNWLAPDNRGARVLDCCAGSGALGFEAMSRGAASVTMLEREKSAYDNLLRQRQRLQAEGLEILAGDALDLVGGLEGRFDIVFVDPPYARPELRGEIFECLEANNRLSDGAMIYFEWPSGEDFELPSQALQWRKSKRAGQVNYAIAEWRLSR